MAPSLARGSSGAALGRLDKRDASVEPSGRDAQSKPAAGAGREGIADA